MANFTRKAIKEAFLKLLNQRPLSQITVKDIVEDCGINRNSFYYHFEDLPALVEELETPTLEGYGIDRAEFYSRIEKMAHDAIESGSPANTVRPITQADVEQMYKNLWDSFS